MKQFIREEGQSNVYQLDQNIYSSIIKIEAMEEIVLNALQNNNKQSLTQILHHKIELQEIQYALGSEDFHHFISTFQVISLSQSDKIDIATGNLYYFLTGGFIIRKAQKQKNNKKEPSVNRKLALSLQYRQTNILQQVQKGQISKMQDFLNSDRKNIGHFQSIQTSQSNERQNKILVINDNKLNSGILQKLRMYYMDKLKYINKLPLFQEMPRNVMQENMEKFKFMKIFFNDLIYSRDLRNNQMFVLMKGQAIIESSSKKSIIVRPPSILGDEKSHQNQKAKCTTQYCVCFSIQREQIEAIFKRKAEIDEKQFQGITKTASVGLLRAVYFRNCHLTSQNTHVRDSLTQDISSVTNSEWNSGKNQSNFKKFRTKKPNFENPLQKLHKNQRIKEHFSNFLNQKYNEYQTKLQKTLQLTNKQTPILYEIKSLSPSTPDYNKINEELKKQRIKKILEPKQNNKRSSSSESLMKCLESHKNRKSSFVLENDCIRDKILKSLEIKIAKQMLYKYGTRVKLV